LRAGNCQWLHNLKDKKFNSSRASKCSKKWLGFMAMLCCILFFFW